MEFREIVLKYIHTNWQGIKDKESPNGNLCPIIRASSRSDMSTVTYPTNMLGSCTNQRSSREILGEYVLRSVPIIESRTRVQRQVINLVAIEKQKITFSLLIEHPLINRSVENDVNVCLMKCDILKYHTALNQLHGLHR